MVDRNQCTAFTMIHLKAVSSIVRCTLVWHQIFLSCPLLLALQVPQQVDVVLQVVQTSFELLDQILEFGSVEIHGASGDPHSDFGHDLAAACEFCDEIADLLGQRLQVGIEIIVGELQVLLSALQQLETDKVDAAVVVQALDDKEDLIGLAFDLVQLAKQMQSVAGPFEGQFLLEVLHLTSQTEGRHLSWLFSRAILIRVTNASPPRNVLQHIYVSTLILIAFDIDRLLIFSTPFEKSEPLSLVDPNSLSFLWMKSANLRGVAGFFLFLRTE